MGTPIYAKQLCCKHCGSGNITFKQLRIGRVDHKDVFSYWYQCAVCCYSSNGRTTLKEAEADAVVLPIDAEARERLAK